MYPITSSRAVTKVRVVFVDNKIIATQTIMSDTALCCVVFYLQGTTMHKVHQLAFHAWPDHGVPASPDVLIRFIFAVRQYIPDGYKAPMCVHCR